MQLPFQERGSTDTDERGTENNTVSRESDARVVLASGKARRTHCLHENSERADIPYKKKRAFAAIMVSLHTGD